jgi:hypothetical protein
MHMFFMAILLLSMDLIVFFSLKSIVLSHLQLRIETVETIESLSYFAYPTARMLAIGTAAVPIAPIFLAETEPEMVVKIAAAYIVFLTVLNAWLMFKTVDSAK